MMAMRPSSEGAGAQAIEEPVSGAQEQKNIPGVREREREKKRGVLLQYLPLSVLCPQRCYFSFVYYSSSTGICCIETCIAP